MDLFLRRSGEARASSVLARMPRLRGALRAFAAIALLVVTGVAAWQYAASLRRPAAPRPTIEGTWDLYAIDGVRLSAATPAPLLSQRIALRNGAVRGEVNLRPGAEGATAALPFPDETVDRVIQNDEDGSLRVLWSGRYDFDEHGQMTLHIGKAVYFIKLLRGPDSDRLELNQDILLTLPGKALYRRSSSIAR